VAPSCLWSGVSRGLVARQPRDRQASSSRGVYEMQPQSPRSVADTRELRLFLEELCCNLLRFHHATAERVPPETISVNQEVNLGEAQGFADIRVRLPSARPYFVEVKHGYPAGAIIDHLSRKYGLGSPLTKEASKVILVIESREGDELERIEKELKKRLRRGLRLEIWTEEHLLKLLREQFGMEIESIGPENVADLRQAVDQAKGRYAFGEGYANDPLQATLLWHFGFWRLRQLMESRGPSPRAVLPPGSYRSVAVLFADLSSFSSYVRDTRDDAVIRHVLTSFYSKTRYEVLNSGGMMYQFLGDGAIALFGVPESGDRSAGDALECARALIDIGSAVSHEWQRSIDHVQGSGGAHIGMALGDLDVVSLRPFSRTHVGVIGDSVNLAARLTSAAAAGEIVVSNALYNVLPEELRQGFSEMEPIEARNIGKIRAWKLGAVGLR